MKILLTIVMFIGIVTFLNAQVDMSGVAVIQNSKDIKTYYGEDYLTAYDVAKRVGAAKGEIVRLFSERGVTRYRITYTRYGYRVSEILEKFPVASTMAQINYDSIAAKLDITMLSKFINHDSLFQLVDYDSIIIPIAGDQDLIIAVADEVIAQQQSDIQIGDGEITIDGNVVMTFNEGEVFLNEDFIQDVSIEEVIIEDDEFVIKFNSGEEGRISMFDILQWIEDNGSNNARLPKRKK